MYELRRAIQLLSVVALLGAIAACNGSESTAQPDWHGGCFMVDSFTEEPPPAPHTEMNDEFCIERDGDDWAFVRGTGGTTDGMEHWAAISGDSKIPMELEVVNPNNISWTMNVDVTNHEPPEPGNGEHGRLHENGLGFRIRVHKYSDPDETYAQVIGASGPSGATHGGSAHANLN